jgi:hypothetical protein
MVPGLLSTGLDEDASSAYRHFARMARTLGSISRSFDGLALRTMHAYFAALCRPSSESWTTVVLATAQIVERANSLRGIVELSAKEREALNFFEAIVRENADIMVVPTAFAADATLKPLDFVSA